MGEADKIGLNRLISVHCLHARDVDYADVANFRAAVRKGKGDLREAQSPMTGIRLTRPLGPRGPVFGS
jgi:hypothetical protein